MAVKPETTFRKKVVAFLNSFKSDKIWFESIQQKSISGTPDILGCVNGRFFAIEVKSIGGKLSGMQAYKLSLIDKAGGANFVVSPDNFEEFKVFFYELYRTKAVC